MATYGEFTRPVPVNLYAIAAERSMVDFAQYVETLRSEIELIVVHDPTEFGLHNCEGAILTGERHIITDLAREYFERELDGHVRLSTKPDDIDDDFDFTVDCTFAANSAAGVDRYEPCIVLLLEGPSDKAVTIMDGQFGSLYPWDETRALCSLSSAKHSPFTKECKSYAYAKKVLDGLDGYTIAAQATAMIDAMAEFYPGIRDFKWIESCLSVRAMPASGADTRLVDVRKEGDNLIRVRAGKIDAILAAEKLVKQIICSA